MHSPINTQIEKYRNDEISSEELRELKEAVDSMTDSEIGDILAEDWEEFCVPDVMPRRRWMPVILSAAAAVAFVLLAGWTWYLHRELAAGNAGEAVFASTPFNNSELTLPDGTMVTFRQDSRLAYHPGSYARGERRVSFDGEGYFDVHSDAEHPFTISAPGFEAVVKGTSFNLYSSAADSIAELALVSGMVELKTADGSVTTLKPNQKAIINRTTGQVTLAASGDKDKVSAWQRNEIILDNASPAEISRAFQRYYGKSVTIDCEAGETFTGTLPLTSMSVAVEVIEVAMGSEVKY